MMVGIDIVNEARTWIGTPFHHQASVKGVGCDCYGLVRGVAKNLGLVPDHVPLTNYARLPDGRMVKILAKELVRVPLEKRRAGDVVVFAYGKQAQHMGILSSRGTLIHAHGLEKRGGVVEVPFAGIDDLEFRHAFRFPELC